MTNENKHIIVLKEKKCEEVMYLCTLSVTFIWSRQVGTWQGIEVVDQIHDFVHAR